MPERPVLRRISAFILLGLLVGTWLIARPVVLARWPMAALLEFPIGLAAVGTLCWLAARPARAREKPEAPWTRHEQVVRPLPDPEAVPLAQAVDAWVETGKEPGPAADVLARALDADETRRQEHRASLLQEMGAANGRRKREAVVRRVLETPDAPNEFHVIPSHERTGA